MDKLTPSAQRTLDALQTGPGNVHELAERTGLSRSTTDKAINVLAKADLIVKVDDGGDPADGAPARWQLADPAPADHETTQPEPTDDGDGPTAPDTDVAGPAAADAATPDPATDPAPSGDSPQQPQDPPPVTDEPVSDDSPTDAGPTADAPADIEATPDRDAEQDGEQKPAEAEPPKLCRGCQAQMPKICECCWQKTPTYCGTCRRTMPQVRRGEPGEPVILSNGLLKLRPGELEDMVEKVMREQPLPAFAGIVGWTGGRLAVHIPGRSPGAMTNAMRKFAKEGKAELIGDDPERYQLIDTAKPDTATDTNGDTGSDAAGQQEAGQPDAAAEPQPDHAG